MLPARLLVPQGKSKSIEGGQERTMKHCGVKMMDNCPATKCTDPHTCPLNQNRPVWGKENGQKWRNIETKTFSTWAREETVVGWNTAGCPFRSIFIWAHPIGSSFRSSNNRSSVCVCVFVDFSLCSMFDLRRNYARTVCMTTLPREVSFWISVPGWMGGG